MKGSKDACSEGYVIGMDMLLLPREWHIKVSRYQQRERKPTTAQNHQWVKACHQRNAIREKRGLIYTLSKQLKLTGIQMSETQEFECLA